MGDVMGDVRHRDVDRGWAWVVLTAVVIFQVIASANETSFGIFQVELFESFPGNPGFVSFIFSVAFGGRFLLGPVAGLLSDVCSSRVPAMLSGGFLSGAMLMASLLYRLVAIFFLFGIAYGIGSGLGFTACMATVNSYFHKYRTLAFGMLLGASGIGMMAGPYLASLLIAEYGWRFTMATFASILAQNCVLATLFYPLNPSQSSTCWCPNSHQREEEREPEKDTTESSEKNNPVDCYDEETELLARPQTIRQRIKALLRQKFLWVICLNQMAVTAGFTTGYNFFPAYAESRGVAFEDIPKLYTVYGLSLITFRLMGGVVFNVFPDYLLEALICVHWGLALTHGLLPLYGVSFGTLFIERVMTAAMYGPSLLLVAPILVRYLGPQNLPVAFGIVMLCSGVGAVTAPAVAGTLYEIYGNFNVCYYLAGGASALAALSLLLIPIVSGVPTSQR